MLKILGRVTSINVRKVLWAADEVGITYEREDWGLPIRDPNVPQFLALNPNAQIPVIIDNGFVLWESHAIMGYFEAAYGHGALLDRAPQAAALVDQWLGFQASELVSQWGYAVQALIRKTPGFDDPAQIAKSLEKWTAKMAILEKHLAGGTQFVAGDIFSLADISISLAIHRWMEAPFDHPEMATCQSYLDRIRARGTGANYLTSTTP